MGTLLYYNRFRAKEQEAIKAFNKAMEAYGLEASPWVGGDFADNMHCFRAELRTKLVRVKGNGQTMKRLKEDGWHFSRRMGHDTIGDDRPMFQVHGYCTIPVEADDLLEYEKPEDIAPMGELTIRKDRNE